MPAWEGEEGQHTSPDLHTPPWETAPDLREQNEEPEAGKEGGRPRTGVRGGQPRRARRVPVGVSTGGLAPQGARLGAGLVGRRHCGHMIPLP